jgi:hypothetical protein
VTRADNVPVVSDNTESAFYRHLAADSALNRMLQRLMLLSS